MFIHYIALKKIIFFLDSYLNGITKNFSWFQFLILINFAKLDYIQAIHMHDKGMPSFSVFFGQFTKTLKYIDSSIFIAKSASFDVMIFSVVLRYMSFREHI